MNDFDLIPVTEREILKEVAEELNIPMDDVDRTFKIWMKYLKYIAKETDQTTIDFPTLGKMYYSVSRSKNINSKYDNDLKIKKLKNIYDFFEDLDYENSHERIPVVHRWGIDRLNFSIGDYKTKFKVDELVEKQNKKFYEDNKFLK